MKSTIFGLATVMIGLVRDERGGSDGDLLLLSAL
jgi:hypothetical protein